MIHRCLSPYPFLPTKRIDARRAESVPVPSRPRRGCASQGYAGPSSRTSATRVSDRRGCLALHRPCPSVDWDAPPIRRATRRLDADRPVGGCGADRDARATRPGAADARPAGAHPLRRRSPHRRARERAPATTPRSRLRASRSPRSIAHGCWRSTKRCSRTPPTSPCSWPARFRSTRPFRCWPATWARCRLPDGARRRCATWACDFRTAWSARRSFGA
jgi:hypothetical protein